MQVSFIKRAVVVLALLGGGAPQLSHAQSFDCEKAESDTEWAICNTPELTRLDIEMATLYQTLETAETASPGFREGLEKEQSAWLASNRDTCGGEVECLDKAYHARIAELEELLHSSLSISD